MKGEVEEKLKEVKKRGYELKGDGEEMAEN